MYHTNVNQKPQYNPALIPTPHPDMPLPFSPVLDNSLLLGLALQFLSLTGMLIGYYAFKGPALFTYDLFWTTEGMRANQLFRVCLAAFALLNLIGALYLTTFQILLSDDASWARGHRAGSKLLAIATSFDALSGVLQFVFFLYMLNQYNETWWLHFKQGGAEWLVLTFGRILHAVALLFYAGSLTLIELYHDEGTSEWHGCVNGFLFAVAGLAEVLVLCHGGGGGVSIVFIWMALLSAVLWASAFEPQLVQFSPKLFETELTNDVEEQVHGCMASVAAGGAA